MRSSFYHHRSKADEDEKNIIRLTSIPFLSFKDHRIAVKGMNKALREAKKQKIDIVHTHTEFVWV